jgi:hypothetical protein
MSISGKESINIGLPNESVGSDSLYTAFTKASNNFTTLFACASPYNTFTSGGAINITTDSSNGIVTFTNTGVTSLSAGSGVQLTGTTGDITISLVGGGGGIGTVTSIGITPISTSRLVVTNTPIVSSGNITIDLATTGANAGTYSNPILTIDAYGRVTSASNGASAGTVTSVGLTPGAGIQINGGPITTNGSITVTNIGVTRITAGSGITASGSNGNITISATASGGTVTSVGLSSNSLNVTSSPIVSAGTINVESPIGFSSENLTNGSAANLAVTASYFSTTGGSTATLAAGTAGQIKTFMMVTHGGDMVITVATAGWKASGSGTITFAAVGAGCTLQYVNSKWFCVGQNSVTFG